MSTEEDYLGPADVRRLLGISEATYYRWLRQRKLPGVRVGRNWRFPRSRVEALLRSDDQRAREGEAAERALSECARRVRRLGPTQEEVQAMIETLTPGEALAELLLQHAMRRGATDLHLAPGSEGVSVRERIDGVLRPVDPPLPGESLDGVVMAFRELACFDSRPAPQEGQFFWEFSGASAAGEEAKSHKLLVRCSSFPTALGESLTIRLCGRFREQLSLEACLGAEVAQQVRAAVRASKGVFLVNGPSGSGKTTTIYSLLGELNRPGLKIMTAEDPVEILIDGLLQAPLQEGMELTDVMRGMLLGDLDVGYVSELRDAESIRLLYRMGTTGHLMLSCLHAPSAASALSRLLELGGVEARLLLDSTLGILDQRLVPTSCPDCRRTERIDPADAERLGLPRNTRVSANDGCARCDGVGVRGRTTVCALLTLTPALRQAIEGGATSPEALAAAGGPTLEEAVREKVRAGEVLPPHGAAVLGR